MKKEVADSGGGISKEDHMRAMATARTFMGLPPLSETELKKRTKLAEKNLKKNNKNI